MISRLTQKADISVIDHLRPLDKTDGTSFVGKILEWNDGLCTATDPPNEASGSLLRHLSISQISALFSDADVANNEFEFGIGYR